MKLTQEQRVALIRLYYENRRNSAEAIRAYRRETGVVDICTPFAVRKLVAKFERTGSVHDAPRSGRPKTAEDVAMEVSLAMADDAEHNPHGESSVRTVAKSTGVATMTVWKLLRKVLKFRPYRIQCMHELKPGDPERRLAFAEDYLTRVEFNPEWIDTIFWSDEVRFTLSGQVNIWNCRIWANENPHEFVQEPLHAEKVTTVWCVTPPRSRRRTLHRNN